MAPEQALGHSDAVTTAADVYGLGAILYALLTGRPPFRGETPLATLQLLREREPAPPRVLRPEVARDLETICLRCLEKDPARRYASAADLADELDRYLAGEPIQARPVGPVGRLQRWCRRQPVLAALAATIILSWALASALVTWQWLQAEENARTAEANYQEADRQRQKAQENQARAEANLRLAHQAVDDFVKQGTEDLLAVPGLQPLRKKLLERALVYHQKFVDQNAEDPGLRAELADTYLRIGNLTRAIGSKQKALAAYRKSLELCDDLLRSHPGQGAFLQQRGRVLCELGFLQNVLGQPQEALATLQEARDSLQRLQKDRPGDWSVQHELAAALYNLAPLYANLGQPAQAVESYRQASGLWEALVKDAPDSLIRLKLANSLESLGLLLERTGPAAEAGATLKRAWQLREQLFKQYPANANVQSKWARACQLRGERLAQKGQSAEALKTLQEGQAVLEGLTKSNPQVRQYHDQLAVLCATVGWVHLDQRQAAEALPLLRQAVAQLTPLARLHPNVPRYQAQLGKSLGYQARAHALLGQGEQELLSWKEARRVQEQLVRRYPAQADYHRDLALTLRSLAATLKQRGQAAEAANCLRKAVEQERQAVAHAPAKGPVPRAIDE
jgi:serine/threonine-protein kinase